MNNISPQISYIIWIPLIVAFIAGFFALYQIKSNNITNARIKWLENLKQLIADFFSATTALTINDGVSKALDLRRQFEPNNPQHQIDLDKINYNIMEYLQMINLKHDLIKLNLNPKEPLHIKFEERLDVFMDSINKIPNIKGDNYFPLIGEMNEQSIQLLSISRYIIKLDWERTKRSYLNNVLYMRFGRGKALRSEGLNLFKH